MTWLQERGEHLAQRARVIGGVLSLATLFSRADAAERTGEGLYEKVGRACFEVLVDERLDGSGWFADANGWGFTAAHVVDHPCQKIEARLQDGVRLPAKVVALDRGFDLALLAVQNLPKKVSHLRLAKRCPLAGEEIYLFSASIFRHGLLQRGMVARNDTTFEYYSDRGEYIETVHLAATVQGSSSGGPWLNSRGEVVGLQSGSMSLSGTPVGVAFLIPAGPIRNLLETRQTARTPTLGIAIEETWQQDRRFWEKHKTGTEGLVVRVVSTNSPAARAGLKEWDIITATDGKRLLLPDDLLRTVRSSKPGQVLRLSVLRQNAAREEEVPVTIGEATGQK